MQKFGWNRKLHFDNLQVLMLWRFGLKTPTHASFWTVLGLLPHKYKRLSTKPPKGTNDCKNGRLSHYFILFYFIYVFICYETRTEVGRNRNKISKI